MCQKRIHHTNIHDIMVLTQDLEINTFFPNIYMREFDGNDPMT
jgi:hypothetical protein